MRYLEQSLLSMAPLCEIQKCLKSPYGLSFSLGLLAPTGAYFVGKTKP